MSDAASSALPALRLFKGQTVHARRVPFEQRFAYELFMVDVDIDRLDEASKASGLFAIDKPALYSLRTKDHGARETGQLRPWADAQFARAGIDLTGGSVRLLALPRHLFYKFSPISLWFGYDPEGELHGIIYEVNNTFGDTHAYVAPVANSTDRHRVSKAMYVSPFFDVSGDYLFTLTQVKDKLRLIIDNRENEQSIHMATLLGTYEPATSGALLKAALTRPLSSHGVTLGIHWEALKLFIKGAGYRSRPPAAAHAQSVATPQAMSEPKEAHS